MEVMTRSGKYRLKSNLNGVLFQWLVFKFFHKFRLKNGMESVMNKTPSHFLKKFRGDK
jgi:hypothetical protein